jgi:SAM-dependent methyltransferase
MRKCLTDMMLSQADIAAGKHRQRVGGYWDRIGRLQFDALVRQGLKPEHYLLDVGCGALRGGVHFVLYLESGHYYGVEKNPTLLDAARHELRLAGLGDHEVHLLANETFDFTPFARRFDAALAQSVFTHIDERQMRKCLRAVFDTLKPGAVFYVTFRPTQRDLLRDIADEMSLQWLGVPYDHPRGQQMVGLTQEDAV